MRGERFVFVDLFCNLVGDFDGEESYLFFLNVILKVNFLIDGSLIVEELLIFIILIEVFELNSCERRLNIIDLFRELDIFEIKFFVIVCWFMDNIFEKNRKNKELIDV